MLKNEYLLAKFGVDTEENELSKVACLPPSPLSIKDLCNPDARYECGIEYQKKD